MIEMNYTACMGRWLNGKLNPDRVESYLVRGKTKKDCLELLNEHAKGCRGTTAYHLRQFAHWCWGTRIKRPAHEGRGVWLTRDHGDTEMTPVWVEHNAATLARAAEGVDPATEQLPPVASSGLVMRDLPQTPKTL